MVPFRIGLVLVFAVIAVYTGLVVEQHGLGLFPAFFGALSELGWQGQFNLDFLCMLGLSGLWVAQRHRFSAAGMLLGLCVVFGGMLFLSAYLLVITGRVKGDVVVLLTGEARR